MMSEAAHDIRAPLAAVLDSVQMVNDGYLGALNHEQQSCLSNAVDQCHCIDQIVSGMMQMDRLRSGIPRIRREWLSLNSIRHDIQQTLQPWITSRTINIVWDIAIEHKTAIFGDRSMMRRLIVNLVVNAIRETTEGGSILVGVHPVAGGDALQWSVVDRGRGMNENTMHQIANQQVSDPGGEGLGLNICRQLSALHFSSLRVESRSGTGTAVSFRTANGGPHAVARQWAQWRISQRQPLRTPVSRGEQQQQVFADAPSEQTMRFDSPSITVELQHEGSQPNVDDRAAAGTVSLTDSAPAATAEAFDIFLQEQAGMYDLVYRTDLRNWTWVFDANVQQADQIIDQVYEQAKTRIPNIHLSWTDPQSIPLDGRRTADRLIEIMQQLPSALPQFAAPNPVEARLDAMLGRHSSQTNSQPDSQIESGLLADQQDIQYSETASLRLDQEVQRMHQRAKNQNSLLKNQAKRIRPQF